MKGPSQTNQRIGMQAHQRQKQQRLLHETSVSTTDVVIIGAGASGLQCSYLLRKAGYSVTLLEARPRVGGRIDSVVHRVKNIYTGNYVSCVVDHGAAWVHGLGFEWPTSWTGTQPASVPTANPMLDLMDAPNELRPVFVRGNPWRRPKECTYKTNQLGLYRGGKALHKDTEGAAAVDKAFGTFFRVMARVSDYGNSLYNAGEGMETARQSLYGTFQRELSQVVVEDENNDLDGLAQFFLYMIEVWYGTSSSGLQLSEFINEHDDGDGDDNNSNDNGSAGGDGARTIETVKDDSDYSPEGDFLGPHCAVRSGMAKLLEPLQGHGETIRLEEPVRRIIRMVNDNTVLVETQTDSCLIRAHCCVVTMSVGCLQQNHESMFSPPLDDAKVDAIGSLGMAKYKKVFMVFDDVFWDPDETFIGLVLDDTTNGNSNPLGRYLLLDNLWASRGLACLEAILVGEAADWAHDRLDMIVCYAVLDFMEETMGLTGTMNLRDRCVDFSITRWEEDPYSCGAYSNLRLGTTERQMEELQRPSWDGTLVFCGEHTCPDYEGSVHAALFSGQRAAKQVQDLLSKTTAAMMMKKKQGMMGTKATR